jgi:hypothetical protein
MSGIESGNDIGSEYPNEPTDIASVFKQQNRLFLRGVGAAGAILLAFMAFVFSLVNANNDLNKTQIGQLQGKIDEYEKKQI